MSITMHSDCCGCPPAGSFWVDNPCARDMTVEFSQSGCHSLGWYIGYNGCGVGSFICDDECYDFFLSWSDNTAGAWCNDSHTIKLILQNKPGIQYVEFSLKWYASRGHGSGGPDECPGTDCPITIDVKSCGHSASKIVTTNELYSRCPDGNVLATAVVYPDGSFDLN